MRRFLRLAARAMGPCRQISQQHRPPPGIRALLAQFFLLAACATGAIGQSTGRLGGRVLAADDGSAAPHAEVKLVGTSFRSVTKADGAFLFEHAPVGVYDVVATAAGFDVGVAVDVRVTADAARFVTVRLQRRIYPVEGVTVVGQQASRPEGTVVVIQRSDIERLRPESVADALGAAPGVTVRETGGGEAQVSIRGSSSKHVLVLVDGQRLNSAGTGVADLRGIPVDAIERIEIHKGGASAEFGPDALAGAINIVTHSRSPVDATDIVGKSGGGSLNRRQNSLSVSGAAKAARLSARFHAGRETWDGDFDYSYSVAPADVVYEGKRWNNRSRNVTYFGRALWKPDGKTDVSFSAQHFSSTNGLPGRASDVTLSASRDDFRSLATINAERRLSQSSLASLALGFSRMEQTFVDNEASSPGDRFDATYINDNINLKVMYQTALWEGNDTKTGAEWRREKLEHVDRLRPQSATGESRRFDGAAFVSGRQALALPRWAVFEEVAVDASLRYDRAKTKPDPSAVRMPWDPPRTIHRAEAWSPRVGATLTYEGAAVLVARGSWGKSLRLPSINALFWKGDARAKGNPDLRPERSEQIEGGVELRKSGETWELSGGVSFFRSEVDDLVVWRKGSAGDWKPQNLGLAETVGREDFVEIELMRRKITVIYQNTAAESRNKTPGHNSYDRFLTYAPDRVTRLSARIETRGVYLSGVWRREGRRYALEGNEKWYEPYSLVDLGAGCAVKLSRMWRLRLDARVDNAGDESYALISGLPMPGRVYGVSVSVEYGLKAGRGAR